MNEQRKNRTLLLQEEELHMPASKRVAKTYPPATSDPFAAILRHPRGLPVWSYSYIFYFPLLMSLGALFVIPHWETYSWGIFAEIIVRRSNLNYQNNIFFSFRFFTQFCFGAEILFDDLLLFFFFFFLLSRSSYRLSRFPFIFRLPGGLQPA